MMQVEETILGSFKDRTERRLVSHGLELSVLGCLAPGSAIAGEDSNNNERDLHRNPRSN